MSLVDTLLTGSQVVVQTRLTGPLTIDLTPKQDGTTSPVLAFLKPKVTVMRGGTVLAAAAPYGEPGEGVPVLLIVAAFALLGLLLLGKGLAR